MPAQTVETKHLYKVSRGGIYLGLIPFVRSEFNYQQDINTPGTTCEIEVAQTLDIAPLPTEPILTENGEPLLTENEIVITTERATEIVGGKDSGRILANGNNVEVWEYSADNINGKLVFSGFMSRFRAKVGDDDTMIITLMSNGQDLDQYVYGNAAYSAQLTQSTYGDYWRLGNSSQWIGGINTVLRSLYQTINGASFTLSKIRLKTSTGHNLYGIYPASVNVSVGLYSGTPDSGTLLATGNATATAVLPATEDLDFVLSTPVTLASGTQYYIKIQADDFLDVWIATSSVYANGGEWIQIGSGAVSEDISSWDIYFILYSGGNNTDATFTSTDPSVMIKNALDGYGGLISYTASTVDLTGYSLKYSFTLASLLDIVRKARELAPADWYWYVDPGTNLLYFKATPTSATHKFILGRHVMAFEMEATIEYIKNVTYFTGGPTAGVNLLKRYTDTASLAINRVGMQRLNDNRILAADEPTAALLADNSMDENNDEVFTADPLTISAKTYNISTISLGDTVSFLGLGTFVDSILFQITSLERYPDYVSITLGRLPLHSDAYVDKIKRDLDLEQTLDNPSAPV